MAFAGNPKFNSYWVRSRDITYADTSTTSAGIAVPANTFVARVILDVTTAFTTGGYVNVGDGDDADGWMKAADMLISDGTTMVRIDTGGANYAAWGGKGYTSADTIDVHIMDSTAGSLFIAAELVPLADVD